ncbi:hypothetical protein [Streptomyces hygroscopicus]|uniref:hypothetical protein n=1 Tax=Streptomyces hygroscopicus TaxID=1912 RepID=UPI001FCC89D7|nr:hypothetical protein [Streptomyces hygroscopicus]BDH09552.1 hypothetical protein HOK021_07310 [Streptomyces hygroscopicus]
MRSATVTLLLAALLGAAPATAAYAAPSNDSVSYVAYGRGGSGSHSAPGGRHSDLGSAGAGETQLAYKSRSIGTHSHSNSLKEPWEVVLVLVVYLGFFGYVGYRVVKKVRGFFRRGA